MDVVELTRRLVNIPSVTNDEGAVCRFVEQELSARGWSVDKQEVPPEGPTPELPRYNLLAQRGGAPLKVVLTTHLDTVPPFIPCTEDDEKLSGRGTCDAKGIFAAMWIAAERLAAEGVEGVGLLAVVGEETRSTGAKMVSALLPRVDWVVNGEPTELVPASGGKGFLGVTVKVQGKAAHSAYPEQGKSAVHVLLPALCRVIEAELPAEPAYGETTVNVGNIQGGVAPNVLAPEASAKLAIRLAAPSAEVEAELRRLLGPEAELEITSRSEPHPIVVPKGSEGVVVRFASDVPNLSKIGRPLMIGPGSIHDAHTSHEFVKKADLHAAVDRYCEIARELLERDPA